MLYNMALVFFATSMKCLEFSFTTSKPIGFSPTFTPKTTIVECYSTDRRDNSSAKCSNMAIGSSNKGSGANNGSKESSLLNEIRSTLREQSHGIDYFLSFPVPSDVNKRGVNTFNDLREVFEIGDVDYSGLVFKEFSETLLGCIVPYEDVAIRHANYYVFVYARCLQLCRFCYLIKC
eukprot:TRINITY_DN9834_c0_g4_i1.p1 TRINITY_DN9834_c0_g4~~TRINITY_DN9834_c0_g4_i1.p1  ORF type:complete len:206 (+),score=2.18 TRINITY_DN9834_c0_g4_i1:88-618(+)